MCNYNNNKTNQNGSNLSQNHDRCTINEQDNTNVIQNIKKQYNQQQNQVTTAGDSTRRPKKYHYQKRY